MGIPAVAINDRSEMEFTVVYSIHLENMMVTLLGRLDRSFSFLQMVLGIAVVTNFSPELIGVFIATIAAYQFVWQPGMKSALAKSSLDRWQELYNCINKYDETELSEQIRQITEKDSSALSSLKLAAHISATIQLDRQPQVLPKLPWWQKVLAFLAGGLLLTR